MTMNHQSREAGIPVQEASGYLRIVQASFCRRTVRLYFLTFFEVKHGHGLALSNEIWAEVMCVSPRWKFQEPVCDVSCFHPLTTETVTVYVETEHLWIRFLLWWGTLLTSLVDIPWVENLFTVVRTLSFWSCLLPQQNLVYTNGCTNHPLFEKSQVRSHLINFPIIFKIQCLP